MEITLDDKELSRKIIEHKQGMGKIDPELKTLNDRLLELNEKHNRYIEKLNDYNRQLKKVFSHYNEIDGVKRIEFSEFRTFLSISQGIKKLNEFVEGLNKIKLLKEKAIAFLDEINDKRELAFNEYFGYGKRVSKIFSEITSGRYVSVNYEDEKLFIVDKRKETLPVNVISKGTYDQLFFAIKLAFAEEILGTVKGFFLLDDPFLAADDKRFENGLRLLNDLSKKGWQILYFSVQKRAMEYANENRLDLVVLGG